MLRHGSKVTNASELQIEKKNRSWDAGNLNEVKLIATENT